MTQSLSNILVHCVFHARRSSPIVRQSDRKALNLYVVEICNRLHSPCLIANGPGNHLHVLLALSPNMAVAEVVKEVKRVSSVFLKDLDDRYYRDFHWQSGYGAFSVSHKFRDNVYQYILHQEEHHQKVSMEAELKTLMLNAHVNEYEERYYWNTS